LFFLILRLISLQEKQKEITQHRFLDFFTDGFDRHVERKCPDFRTFPVEKVDIGTFKAAGISV